jgi:hypothetical protein
MRELDSQGIEPRLIAIEHEPIPSFVSALPIFEFIQEIAEAQGICGLLGTQSVKEILTVSGFS